MNNDNCAQTLPVNLKNEISSLETLYTEFKKSYSEKKEIQETMIAFANASGGRIFIGVEEISKGSGIQSGRIIGVTSQGISEASTLCRNWAGSFRPRIDVSFDSYKDGENRVDVIKVNESTQKPVCSNAGLYKIRSADGNTGIDPALLREMVVGYKSFKSALILECRENLSLLEVICEQSNAAKPNLNELHHSTIEVILANGALSSFFNIKMLIEIRNLCILTNKLLDFAISAGGVVIPRKTFYDKINEICPILKKYITDLLLDLLKK